MTWQVWDQTPWYEKPLLCVLWLHHWKTHPGDFRVLCCTRCGREELRA